MKLLEPALAQFRGKGARPGHDFRMRSSEVDFRGRTVARFEHFFHGIRVEGADLLGAVTAEDTVEPLAYPHEDLLEPPLPFALSANHANDHSIKLAEQALNLPAHEPRESWAELVLQPQIEREFLNDAGVSVRKGIRNPSQSRQVVRGWRLVHVVNHFLPTRRQAYTTRVDAQTGELLGSGPNGSCTATTVSGYAEFNRPNGSPLVSLPADQVGTTYSLRRGNIFSVNAGDVLNAVYSSTSPTFGDGLPYTSGQSTSTNGQTQAVDIAWGMNATYDFFFTMFGRRGIDGSDGYFMPISAHHPNNLPNGAPARAWWSRTNLGQESYWIDFTDRAGAGLMGGPTELSVTAHEWTHQVNRRCSRVGSTDGSSVEQKGINEGSSTILSTAVRLWDWSGRQGGIGSPDPWRWTYDWAFQPQVLGGYPGNPSPKGNEFLFRPSRPAVQGGQNNVEPSWWTYSKTGWPVYVHAYGAPLLRFFFFLANGAAPITDLTNLSDTHRGKTSPFMPLGFAGIGVHNATVVYYQAFTQTFTETMDLPGAGQALIRASDQLFGAGSATSQAVANALAAVNLAGPWSYSFPSIAHDTPATALPLPVTKPAGRLVGTLPAGSGSEYYLVTVPAGISLWASTFTPRVSANTPQLQGPGLQVLNASGTTVIVSANPVLENLIGNYLSGGAEIAWKNETGSTQTYLVRVFSPQSRAGSYTCNFNTRLLAHEFTSDEIKAMQW